MACLIYSCLEKALEFYSDNNTQFINTLGLDVIQFMIVGTIFNLAMETQFLACVQPLSLFQTMCRQLDSLYIWKAQLMHIVNTLLMI